jgi:hypothetical protein
MNFNKIKELYCVLKSPSPGENHNMAAPERALSTSFQIIMILQPEF